MFITNNHASYPLWSKLNLGKHQKIMTMIVQLCKSQQIASILMLLELLEYSGPLGLVLQKGRWPLQLLVRLDKKLLTNIY